MGNKIMGTQLNNVHNERGKYLNMRNTNYERLKIWRKVYGVCSPCLLISTWPKGVAAEASYAPHTFTHTTLA